MGDPFLDAARAGEGGAGQRGEVPAATVVPAPEALAFQLVAAPLDDVAAAAAQTAPALVERGGLVGDHFRQAAAVARRSRRLRQRTALLRRKLIAHDAEQLVEPSRIHGLRPPRFVEKSNATHACAWEQSTSLRI
jgi:hypothetical protein